ncbi:MAG: AbrB family transcriptional regulator, partial [Alphaproteobacteria bacterium]|nr:AbrB family transcriptional regulator [Alphaproteobacteria bacterium]
MRPVLSDIPNIIVTATIAFGTGYAFQFIGLPAPFLLGSLFGVWIIGAAVPPIQTRVGIPRWLHVPVILGLGTLIGANFRPDVLAHIGSAGITVAAMIFA